MRKCMVCIIMICFVTIIGLGPYDRYEAFANSVEVGLKPTLLDIDVRFTDAYFNEDDTIKGNIYLYKRDGSDASELSDYVLYTVDEKRNPISLIKESNRAPTSCTLQDNDYNCVIVMVDNVPFPANVFGLAVYSKMDTSLQNALAVSPIWAGGYSIRGSGDGNRPYVSPKVSFTDDSPISNEVKGKLVWDAAKDESRLSGYEVYMVFREVPNRNKVYREYVKFVSKGSSTYVIDIAETSFTAEDDLISFEIYPKSVFGPLSRERKTAYIKDNTSGGMDQADNTIVYSNLDKPMIPEYIKPIPAPQAPTDPPAIQVFVDGGKLEQKQAPFIENNTTLVQFRPVFEKLGLKIEWNAISKTIKGNKPGLSVIFTIGHLEATVNGETKILAAPPKIINGSTYIPLRFVSEATGRKVIWDGNLAAIYIIDSASEGKLNYPSGSLMYEGQLKDGKMNGKGKLYRENGALWYDAEFVNNEVTGLGSIYFGISTREGISGQDSMKGSFLAGLPHGNARYYLGDGSLAFDGHFNHGDRTDGKQYAQGVMVYDGHWKNKQYDGFGKYYQDGFLQYEGNFVANAEQGFGKMYAKEGYVAMEGEFKLGKADGPIKMFFPNGQVSFAGTFKNSMIWGDAKEYYSNGELNFDGSYDRGKRSTGRYYYKDGTYFEGSYNSNKPSGMGKLFNKTGELIYEGSFESGKAALNKIYDKGDF
jgi:antitoxin component YwqK of YwqJK toxin-antitoxin module